jgi:putative multiple sugar transport system substrate-binding protein
MKRILSVVTMLAMVITILGAGIAASASTKAAKILVGISMPTKVSQRWIDDGNNMVKEFQAKGYATNLQYANNVVEAQVSQIENMITKGAKMLVIAAIDGSVLTDVLQTAHDKGIAVISYDRLITKTPNVDYYATFDNFKVGVLQAGSIVKALKLDKGVKGPLNIELFAGSPDDTNAGYFFNGAMSVLNPYIKSGVLVVKSGQTAFAQCATLRWDPATAQARMDNLLSKNYATEKVAAVLSPYDGLSIGILSSLKQLGYGTAGQPIPVVSGQDCEIPSIKSIIAGEQTTSIFKDTRVLAKKAVEMAIDVLNHKKPVVNDLKTYNNGVKIVPSFLCTPVVVDKSNYKKVLVDGGYYKASQLK